MFLTVSFVGVGCTMQAFQTKLKNSAGDVKMCSETSGIGLIRRSIAKTAHDDCVKFYMDNGYKPLIAPTKSEDKNESIK